MSPICPDGHDSTATDYCDVCGTPMGAVSSGGVGGAGSGLGAGAGSVLGGQASAGDAAGARPTAAEATPAPAGPPTQTCPNCAAMNRDSALFCEACGYDFTTGAKPLTSGSALDLDTPPAEVPAPEGSPPSAGPPIADPPIGEPAMSDEAASGAGPEPTPAPGPDPGPLTGGLGDQDPLTGGIGVQGGPEAVPDVPPAAPDAPPDPGPAAPDPAPAAPAPAVSRPAMAEASRLRPAYAPPSRSLHGDWIIEVWIDPDWYAVQDNAEACPSPGVPDIVPVHSSNVLVGRPSVSRGIRPDVDGGADSGVSRRHCQFTSDGKRWWVEDLNSSNGMYVGPAAGPLPEDPIRPGQRVEVDEDDRIYVGAWTRLVLRRATDSEVSGHG